VLFVPSLSSFLVSQRRSLDTHQSACHPVRCSWPMTEFSDVSEVYDPLDPISVSSVIESAYGFNSVNSVDSSFKGTISQHRP
jgi:hypothetical protein